MCVLHCDSMYLLIIRTGTGVGIMSTFMTGVDVPSSESKNEQPAEATEKNMGMSTEELM